MRKAPRELDLFWAINSPVPFNSLTRATSIAVPRENNAKNLPSTLRSFSSSESERDPMIFSNGMLQPFKDSPIL
jgi:hypothetical protein